MSEISVQNVTDRFRELTRLTPLEAEIYLPTILSAMRYFTRLLKRPPTEDELAPCEYAAACKANYDYAVLNCSRDKTFSTQTGSIFAKISSNETVISAENLWHQALASLPEGLVRDAGFVFEGVR